MPQGAPIALRSKMWLDYQNDVKVSDVQLAAREGYESSKVALLTRADYSEKKGIVTIKLHDELAPYLLQIKENPYFKFHIEATRPMSNYHIIRLYWFLISWSNKERLKFSLETIKEAIDLEKTEYQIYQDFPDLAKLRLKDLKIEGFELELFPAFFLPRMIPMQRIFTDFFLK